MIKEDDVIALDFSENIDEPSKYQTADGQWHSMSMDDTLIMTDKQVKELQKVITHLIVAYSEALKKDYVNKPMAYALYEVWKVWDNK